MALRILQFGAVFAIGFYLGPTSPFARALDIPELSLSLKLTDPKDVIVPKGQAATLRCDAESSKGGLQIAWLYNGAPLELNDTRWIQQEDGSLYIQKVISGKKPNGVTGEYECLVTNKAGTLRSSVAKLKAATMDREFARNPSNLVVAEFQPALLRCSIPSTPPAEIQWEFNNLPLPQHTRYVPLPNGVLLISSSHKSDAGSYRCKATNNILNKNRYSKSAVLSVSPSLTEAKPPTFLPLEIPLNNTVYVGKSLSLYCAVMGWPKPVVQWLNNESVVIGNSTILRIANARVQQGGNYTCLAFNTKDRISQTFRVEVVQKPYFNVTPTSKAYPVAKTVRLECQANGVPDPRITWLKNGLSLVYKNHMKKQANGLVLSHTFSSDSGIYQCVAMNSAGRIWTAAQIEIDDSHSPRPPDNLQCRPYNSTTICLSWMSPANEDVQAYSIYSYYKGQVRDEPGLDFISNETFFTAVGFNSSTNYTFYVRSYSNAASDRSKLVTCETGVKGNRNLDIVPINANSVSLKWTEISTDVPCNGIKTPYKVQWKREGHSTINVERTSRQTHRITGLLPGTNYEFRITSTSYDKDFVPWTPYTHSKIDNSINVDNEKSNTTNGTDKVPPPPEQLEGTPDSPTSIKLVWADVANKKFYTVCYVLVKEGKKCEDGELLKSFSNKLELSKLKSNTTYEFKVRTHNLEGLPGPFSSSIEVQTPADVPSPVMDLKFKPINETTACLRWKAPAQKNGKLQKYIISYTPDKNRPLENWIDVSIPSYQRKSTACWLGDQDTVSTLLGNLSSNTYYTVLVRAISDVGIGKPTVPIEVITNPQETTEEHTPNLDSEMEYHKKVGVIIGVIMALMCIVCCITCILVRRRCLKRRALARARMAASNNYYPAVAHYASHVGSVQVRLEDPCAANLHEIQHLVSEGHSTHIPPISPSHLDTKGGEEFPNGHVNGSAKPYMNGHLSNGHVHITENPQFFAFESNGDIGSKRSKHSPALRYEEDSNSNVRPSKFYDLYRLFENSKKSGSNYHQCNPPFEQNLGRFRGSTNSMQSLNSSGDDPLTDKQSTCLDDSLDISVVNCKRIPPVLDPNG